MNRCWAVVAISLAGTVAQADVLNPISPTNSFYNQDVIWENAAGTAAPNTFGSREFFEQGAQDPSQQATYLGLNSSRNYSATVGGDTLNFQLQPYNGKNIVQISGSGSVTFNLPTLTGGQQYSAFGLALIGTGNTSTPSVLVTINYSDSTTDQTTESVPDWGNSATNELFNVSRTNGSPSTTTHVDTSRGNVWSAFYYDLAADPGKMATSITFSNPNLTVGIMAVSASTVPEPTSLAMLALGGCGLLARRRRA